MTTFILGGICGWLAYKYRNKLGFQQLKKKGNEQQYLFLI